MKNDGILNRVNTQVLVEGHLPFYIAYINAEAASMSSQFRCTQ